MFCRSRSSIGAQRRLLTVAAAEATAAPVVKHFAVCIFLQPDAPSAYFTCKAMFFVFLVSGLTHLLSPLGVKSNSASLTAVNGLLTNVNNLSPSSAFTSVNKIDAVFTNINATARISGVSCHINQVRSTSLAFHFSRRKPQHQFSEHVSFFSVLTSVIPARSYAWWGAAKASLLFMADNLNE